MVSSLQEMPKMVLNVCSLSEVELLQFLTLNLCGFDPGLEAGSSHYIQPRNLSSALQNTFLFQKTGTEFTNYPEYMLIIIIVMPEM